MTKGEIIDRYRAMSTADRRAVDRWLKANLVFGAIVSAGLLMMALASSNAFGPVVAMAESEISTEAPQAQGLSAPLSPFELMSQLAPGGLPVQQVDEPF